MQVEEQLAAAAESQRGPPGLDEGRALENMLELPEGSDSEHPQKLDGAHDQVHEPVRPRLTRAPRIRKVVEASAGRSAEKTVGRELRGLGEQLMINSNDEN